MTTLNDELQQHGTTGHEPPVLTTVVDEGIHEQPLEQGRAERPEDRPPTTEGGTMSTMTAPQLAASEQRPILLRLPFSPEPIRPAPAPPPETRFDFAPGAWERLVVAAGLDRESRELGPAMTSPVVRV